MLQIFQVDGWRQGRCIHVTHISFASWCKRGIAAILDAMCVWVQHEGLKVTDVVVLIDREQGGAARMASNNLTLHSAFTLSFIIKVLLRHGLLAQEVADSVAAFIAGNQTFGQAAQPKAPEPSKPKRCASSPSLWVCHMQEVPDQQRHCPPHVMFCSVMMCTNLEICCTFTYFHRFT